MAYSQEFIQAAKDHIIDRMIFKKESLNAILSDDYDLCLPSEDVVYRWLRVGHDLFDPDFSENYTHARTIRADIIFEEMLTIADDGQNDTYTYIDGNGKVKTKTDWDVVNRSKLRIDTRKWILSRMDPKKFSDKVEKTVIKANSKPDPVDYKALKDSTLEDIVANGKSD